VKCLVLLDEDEAHCPGASGACNGEACHGEHRQHVARLVRLAEEVWRVDERGVRDGGHHGNNDGLLLWALRAHGCSPSEVDAVDSVSADGEDAHGNVSTRSAESERSDHKADCRHGFASGNVPGTLVVLARGEGDED